MDDSRNDRDIDFVVEPFMFEPTFSASANAYSPSDESFSSDSADDSQRSAREEPPLDLDEWCSCGICTQMPTEIECCCCRQFSRCLEIMEPENHKCITEYEGFIVNCLNTHVLTLAFYEYLDYHGHIGDEEPIHEVFRYVSYRRYTRLIWKRLGKKNRKVIPSCVVVKIREAFIFVLLFPSQQYTGFKYPTDY